MGMTFQSAEDSKWRRIHDEVNRMYLENREEMETTTVCHPSGEVEYVHGKPPEPEPPPDSVKFTPGGGTNVKHRVPDWKIQARRRKAKSDEAAVIRAYPVV